MEVHSSLRVLSKVDYLMESITIYAFVLFPRDTLEGREIEFKICHLQNKNKRVKLHFIDYNRDYIKLLST